MITLHEYKSINLSRFISIVKDSLTPFAEIEPGVIRGSEVKEYMAEYNPNNYDRVPAVIQDTINHSEYAIIKNYKERSVIWFIAETVNKKFVVRSWQILAPGYAVNKFGTVIHIDSYLAEFAQLKDENNKLKIKKLSSDSEMVKGLAYTIAEAAEILDVTTTTIHNNYIKRGMLAYYKSGDNYNAALKVSSFSLEEFCQKRDYSEIERVQPTAIYKASEQDIFGNQKQHT